MKKYDLYKNYTTNQMLTGQSEIELTDWSIEYFKANISKHLPKNKSVQIMDIGCGYGRNIKALQILGYKNTRGVDISEEQINYAKTELGLKNVKVSDALHALSGIERYDVILMLDVLEHLEIDYSIELIEAIRKKLLPNGVFIIQVPNALSPLSVNRYGDITHLRAYTVKSMEQHLRLGGFNKMSHYELPPHIHGIASLLRRVLWLTILKPLISSYMLIANSSLMGGIYTSNLLTVTYLDE